MRPFAYENVSTTTAAVEAGIAQGASALQSPVHYLAGGTTLIDLMKLDVMRPETVVDINPLAGAGLGRIESDGSGLRLGALARMADAAGHPAVAGYPVIAQSLKLAASQQLR